MFLMIMSVIPQNIVTLPHEKKIFLMGLPGCGKTFIGKKLATTLQRPFFDLDELITQHTGKTIVNIFTEEGEEAFRKIETETLRQYIFPQNAVVALGGGTPCFNDNISWLKKNGITIYIKAPPDVIVANLKDNVHSRPLLSQASEKDLKKLIAKLLKQREQFYTLADIIWEISAKTHLF
jgi:shikimate kinase